jgi:hypothetical protein
MAQIVKAEPVTVRDVDHLFGYLEGGVGRALTSFTIFGLARGGSTP